MHLGNAVLDKSGYAVLIDFGSSEEVKYGNSISYGTDIKDLGHCIFQMLTLQVRFIRLRAVAGLRGTCVPERKVQGRQI